MHELDALERQKYSFQHPNRPAHSGDQFSTPVHEPDALERQNYSIHRPTRPNHLEAEITKYPPNQWYPNFERWARRKAEGSARSHH